MRQRDDREDKMYMKDCKGNLAKTIQNVARKIKLKRQNMNTKQRTQFVTGRSYIQHNIATEYVLQAEQKTGSMVVQGIKK